MNKFKMLDKFSQKQVAAIELGTELAKHYIYEKENSNGINNKFESFAKTTNEVGRVISYTEKNNLFWNLAIDEAYDISGMNKEKTNIATAFTFPHFERAFFSIVEETINAINTKTEIEQALNFCEVQSKAEGDTLAFHVSANRLLSVSTVANGVRNVHFQSILQDDFTLNPKLKKTGVKVDIHRVATNMYDWGHLINLVGKSFRTKLQQEVIDLVYGGYSGLAASFKEATYAQDSFIQLCERVEAVNGAQAIVIGTKTALNTILPTSDYLKFGNGVEYMESGYIAAPFGFPTLRLQQSVQTNSAYDFSIDNDYVIIISGGGTDKIVKVGMGGQTSIRQSIENDTADNARNYTITSSWESALNGSSYYGIVKVR